ncbi:MAG TPA: Coagulation factor 5/8 type domain-containing protein [Solirubrobacterales bacterium]|nr:Coagulation factor 5/8 type domain-containing protein [Solirubrobacterales bacterium]
MPAPGYQKRGWQSAVLALAIALVFGVAPPAHAAPELTRHSIAGGCFALEGSLAPVASGPFRFQATDLATYLLYETDREFVADGGGGLTSDARPSPRAEWKVSEAPGEAFRLTNLGTGLAERFELDEARGCADYPEIQVGTRGKPAKGDSAIAETRGFWDPHMHLMVFEAFGGGFHCGRPWHRYGVPYALPDCSYLEGRAGTSLPENFLNWGAPVHLHDTAGWPNFNDWPNYHSFTYEQTYYKWIERAWRGGLRLGVNLFVDNRSYCDTLAQKQNQRNPCDEMNTVRLQQRAIYEMQDYIDAQSGGPGKGFFRIVTNPFAARKVINDGKLAVLLGIEVSELFDCTPRAGALCDRAHVDRSLDEVYDMGVRDLELLNKYDNEFVGVRFDSGTFESSFVNLGNYYTSGHFWKVKPCDGREADNTIELPQADLLFDLGIGSLIPPGGLPVYPSPPHCNVLGMTPVGEYLVNEMIDRGMILDPDHMSVDAANRALEIARARRYSGVVSSHSWTDERNWPDIYELGGVVAPQADDSDDFVETWRKLRKMRDPDRPFGFGFGDDLGGFSSAGGPREGAENPVRYPFESFDGVKMMRQRSGTRTFDINLDGTAHIGMYPDWVEDLRMQAGGKIVRDLARGSEAYLQMWERAVGVPPERCLPGDRLTARGGGTLGRGASARRVLMRVGQPVRRIGRAYVYCVKGGGKLRVEFDRSGHLRRVAG